MGYIETKRDYEVVKFVKLNPCYSKTIADIFFGGKQRIANRRLQKMYEYKYLDRHREYVSQPYFYYKSRKQPKQCTHLDLVARSYLFLLNAGYKIIEWEREPKNLKGVRPDVKTLVEKNGRQGIIYIEVERYNNCLKQKIIKYEDNYDCSKPFTLLYICNDRCDIATNIKVTQVKLDML